MQLVVTGCDAWPQTITLELANTEENLMRDLTIYPNPNNGQFSLNLPEEDCEISIVNNIGQQVFNQKAKGTTNLNLENLGSGMYFVTVKSTNAVSTLKFVKD